VWGFLRFAGGAVILALAVAAALATFYVLSFAVLSVVSRLMPLTGRKREGTDFRLKQEGKNE